MAFPTEKLRNPLAVARFVLTCLIGLAIDLWTKHWAFATLAHRVFTDDDGRVRVDSGIYSFIPGWLHFETTANQGAVFGLGQGQVKLFLVVSLFAIALLTWMFATSGRRWFPQVVLGMLLAGVLGNMYDRVTVGYVRDMIHMLPGRNWPGTQTPIFPWIFNVADVMLCVGVGLTLILGLFQRHEATPESRGTPNPVRKART